MPERDAMDWALAAGSNGKLKVFFRGTELTFVEAVTLDVRPGPDGITLVILVKPEAVGLGAA